MTHRLTTDCVKNYCNRTLIVKVIVENVVTCFLLGHSVVTLAVSPTVFEILTLKARKSLNFSDRPLFEAPVREEPLRIW